MRSILLKLTLAHCFYGASMASLVPEILDYSPPINTATYNNAQIVRVDLADAIRRLARPRIMSYIYGLFQEREAWQSYFSSSESINTLIIYLCKVFAGTYSPIQIALDLVNPVNPDDQIPSVIDWFAANPDSKSQLGLLLFDIALSNEPDLTQAEKIITCTRLLTTERCCTQQINMANYTLYCAIQGNHHALVLRLLKGLPGTMVNISDVNGYTPLILAVRAVYKSSEHRQYLSEKKYDERRVSIIKNLLKYGAHPGVPDRNGYTALMHAEHIGQKKIIGLLQKASDNLRDNPPPSDERS
jgi:Ankyrin repeat